jgi:hypothetical protein
LPRRERVSRTLFVLLVALCVGCGKGGLGLPGIGVTLDISEQKIPGAAPPALQSSCAVNIPGAGALSPDALQPISLTLKGSKELQGQSALGFTKVTVDHVDLNITPPSQAGQNWDFLDSIKLFASVAGSGNPPVLVAVLDPVPRGQTSIRIKGTGADISDIASHDHFDVSGEVSGRPPCADVHFDGDAEFEVTI